MRQATFEELNTIKSLFEEAAEELDGKFSVRTCGEDALWFEVRDIPQNRIAKAIKHLQTLRSLLPNGDIPWYSVSLEVCIREKDVTATFSVLEYPATHVRNAVERVLSKLTGEEK